LNARPIVLCFLLRTHLLLIIFAMCLFVYAVIRVMFYTSYSCAYAKTNDKQSYLLLLVLLLDICRLKKIYIYIIYLFDFYGSKIKLNRSFTKRYIEMNCWVSFFFIALKISFQRDLIVQQADPIKIRIVHYHEKVVKYIVFSKHAIVMPVKNYSMILMLVKSFPFWFYCKIKKILS